MTEQTFDMKECPARALIHSNYPRQCLLGGAGLRSGGEKQRFGRMGRPAPSVAFGILRPAFRGRSEPRSHLWH